MLIYTHSGQCSQTDKDKHGAENHFALKSVSTNIKRIVKFLSEMMQDKEPHQYFRNPEIIWRGGGRHKNPAEAGSCSIWSLSRSKEVLFLWRDPTSRWRLVANSLIRPECVLTARLSCSTSSCNSLTWLPLKVIKSTQYTSRNCNLFVIVTMILCWIVGSRLSTTYFDFWVRFEQNGLRKLK